MGQTSVSYLRMPLTSRMDRVSARHAEHKSRRWIKWSLIAVLALGLGFALWKGATYLLGKTLMAVNSVEVYGLNYLNRDEIDKALDGFKLDNTLEADTADIEHQLMTLDYIAEVNVEKVYPNRIVINIKERLPVAYSMQGGNLVALSSDGYPLPVDIHLGAPTMPLFYGDVASEDGSSDQVELSRNMLGILGIMRVELPQLYSQVESVKSSAQAMRLNDGSIIICGWNNTKADLARLSAIRSLLASQGEKASSYDLRYKNQVIVRGLASGIPTGNGAQLIAANPMLPANPETIAKKDAAIKKPEVLSNKTIKPKTSKKTETNKKTNSSLQAGPKSRAKSSKTTTPNSGKKVGR